MSVPPSIMPEVECPECGEGEFLRGDTVETTLSEDGESEPSVVRVTCGLSWTHRGCGHEWTVEVDDV